MKPVGGAMERWTPGMPGSREVVVRFREEWRRCGGWMRTGMQGKRLKRVVDARDGD